MILLLAYFWIVVNQCKDTTHASYKKIRVTIVAFIYVNAQNIRRHLKHTCMYLYVQFLTYNNVIKYNYVFGKGLNSETFLENACFMLHFLL